MASQPDVRCIALSLPEAVEVEDRFAFEVPNKGKLKRFVWVWRERVTRKKPKVPQPKVYPAVLVRLPAVTARELRPLITDAWRCLAPKDLVERFDR